MATITAAYRLGAPQVAGALVVYPVFGPTPRLEYQGLGAAIKLGASVKELDSGASVRDVLVDNPTDVPILVYEGEQITGAQQNRTFDASVLVPAKSRVTMPVSCVEQGRWDHRRHQEPFAPSAHAPDPALRAARRARANTPGSYGRPDQHQTWHAVAARLEGSGVDSGTQSLEDLFVARRSEPTFTTTPGQTGAVVEVSGRPVALDLVGRSDVFAELAPRLASGYALQATRAKPVAPDDAAAERFLAAALDRRREPIANPGLGRAFKISDQPVTGAGLEYDGELIALSGFPQDLTAAPAAA
jgi:hypothetical protein